MNRPAKALVIGYGSIGMRHARILSHAGHHTAVVSSRGDIDFHPRYQNLAQAVSSENPDYVVVANTTAEHYRTLEELAAFGFHGAVLVEKPLFESARSFDAGGFKDLFVAYNLRFHPLLIRLKRELASERVLSALAYVGKYLPEWRTQKNYRTSYSASRSAGGGVLRDLSHEIDYLLWMLGGWKKTAAVGGHFSHLEIDSDDTFGLLFSTERCPLVMLQMNYTDRIGRREIIINTDRKTFVLNLITGEYSSGETRETVMVDRDYTYEEEHRAALSRDRRSLCSYDEAQEVLKLVEAAEKSSAQNEWVTR